jgi:hypothetical protein
MRQIIGLFLVVLFAVVAGATGCTENQRAKNFGGSYTVNLPSGQKLVNASWKNDDLWYLVRPMRDGETPETLTLVEDSSFGVLSGTVTFVESH